MAKRSIPGSTTSASPRRSATSRARVTVDGHQVKVVTGTHTQTVNVMGSGGQGKHEAIYRLPIRAAVESAGELPAVATLTELYEWLERRGGERETSSGRGSRLAKPVQASLADTSWVDEAVVATERAITRLVDEFIAHPFLHRVESSLHCRLYEFLMQERLLQADYELGDTGRRTQLVHKEWPETIADVGAPRGLFDLAIVAPQQLSAASERQFRQGRLNPPIVIEVALDYGFHHLEQDHEKVRQSEVLEPYLVHFSRIRTTDETKTIALIENPAPAKTAYVHHAPNGGLVTWKHLAESQVHP